MSLFALFCVGLGHWAAFRNAAKLAGCKGCCPPLTQQELPLADLLPFCAASGTQLLFWQIWQSGQSATVPFAAGSPPQCHPAFSTPTPGSDAITEPSVLTVPVPIATNDARS